MLAEQQSVRVLGVSPNLWVVMTAAPLQAPTTAPENMICRRNGLPHSMLIVTSGIVESGFRGHHTHIYFMDGIKCLSP